VEGNIMLRGVRIAALTTLWLVPLLILVSAFNFGWVSSWRTVGVPAIQPRFLDFYNIATAVETFHRGGDPLVMNWGDPYHRPMNYPRVWLYLFSAAGITRGNVSTAAILVCVFYLACLSFLILETKHVVDAVILLLASLSISPMLAMERGNNDLVVFSLVFLACFVTNRYLKSGLYGAAALLKFFPLVAMIIDGMRRPIKERMSTALPILLVVMLILLQWHDLVLIRHATPVSTSMSYGTLSLKGELLRETARWGFLSSLGWTVVMGCWLIGALAIRNGWGNLLELNTSVFNSKFAESFSVFGGIYVFTYAIGSNWDYRLIFLLPTLPLAMEMARGVRHRLWAVVYLVSVGIAENSIALETSWGTIPGHIATFVVFILLLAMLTNQAKNLYVERTAPVLVEAGSLIA
jgi:hypothetical protein